MRTSYPNSLLDTFRAAHHPALTSFLRFARAAKPRLRTLLLAGASLGAAAGMGHAATIAWTNVSGGSWSTAANWNLHRLPAAADDVLITSNGSYTVTMNSGVSVSSLTLGGAQGKQTLLNPNFLLSLKKSSLVATNGILSLNGGSLTAGGALAIQGRFNWNAGDLNPGASLTVATNGVLNLNANTSLVALAVTLTNYGTVNWLGGDLQVQNDGATYTGAVWNQDGGLWNLQCDQAVLSWAGGERFHNAGSVLKSAASATSSFGVYFDGPGKVEAQSGTIELSGGGNLTGDFLADDSAAINLVAGDFLAGSTATFGGAGSFEFTGDTLTLEAEVSSNVRLAGGTVFLAPPFEGGTITHLTLSGATLGGSNTVTGSLTLEGTAIDGSLTVLGGGVLDWTGGQLNAGSTLAINPAGVLNLTGGVLGGALTNQGVLNWLGGDLQVRNDGATWSGAIWNQAGGSWVIQCDQTISGVSGTEQFRNEGSMLKTGGAGATTFGLYVSHTGSVEAENGTIRFNAGGHLSGSFLADAGAEIDVVGSFAVGPWPSFGGAGVIQASGATLTLDPAFGGGTIHHLDLAGITLSGTNTVAGDLVLNGGSVNGMLTVQNGAVFSGSNVTLNGAVVIEGGGTFEWNGGTLSPAASLTIAPSGVMNLNGATLAGALTNQGMVNWQGGAVTIENDGASYAGAVWNEAGALWDIQCEQTMSCYSCTGLEQFHNAGLVQKSEGFNPAAFGVYFDNRGEVEAQIGTVRLYGGGSLVAGSLRADVGASILMNGGNFTLGPGCDYSGAGSFQFTAGNFTLVTNANPALRFTGGTVSLDPSFQGGAITNLALFGATLVGTNSLIGDLTLQGGGVGGMMDILDGGHLAGTNATLSGSVAVDDFGVLEWMGGRLDNNSALTVSTVGELDILDTVYLDSPLTNYGTVNWQAGTVVVRNDGGNYAGAIWNADSGFWDLQSDQTMSCNWCGGSEQFHNAGLLLKSAGAGTASINVYLDNSGAVVTWAGTLRLNSGSNLGGTFLADAGAVIELAGDNTIAPWNVFAGPGTFRVVGGTQTLVADFNPNLRIEGGAITLDPSFQGGAITNLALYGGVLEGTNTVSGELALVNSYINGPLTVAPGGLVNATNCQMAGAMEVESNGALSWWGGQFDPASALSVDTNGVLHLNGANLYGVVTNQGTVIWEGGDLAVHEYAPNGYLGEIWNQTGAVWDIQCDQTLSYGYWLPTFHNAGLLRKSAGVGTTSFDLYLDNSGIVQAQTGTLQFNAGGSPDGSFQADANAAIYLRGGDFSWDGTSIFQGPGTVAINGGSLTITATITNLTAAGVAISGLSNVVGTANLTDCAIYDQETISGVVNWQGLNLGYSGSLTVATNGVLNLVSNDIHHVYAALTNDGTINWLGGDIYVYNGAEPGGTSYGPTYTGEIWNETGAQWSIQCDQTLTWAQWDSYGNWWGWLGGVTTFHNAGALTKTAQAGTTTVASYLDNSGTVQALSGTIQFGSGGTLDGVFQADAGAAINLSGGDFSWDGTGVFEGPGTIQITGGSVTITGATTNLTASGAAISGLSNVVGTATLNNCSISGAETITGTVNWQGMVLNPSGSLTVATNGVLNLVGNGIHYVYAALTNLGTLNWQGGEIEVFSGWQPYWPAYTGEIWNEIGAQWNIQCDETLTWAQWWNPWWGTLGGVTTFHNAGAVTKTAGTGATTVYNYLDNSGAVQARSGTIQFGEGSNLGGSFQADRGAEIDFSGNFNYVGTSIFQGPGTVQINGGSVTITGATTNLSVSGATLSGLSNVVGTANLTDCAIDDQETISGVVNWQGLNLGYSGSLTVAPNGVLNLVSNDNHHVYAALTNFGTINWLGGDIYVYNGAEPGGASYGPTYTGEIWNETGAQWTVQCDQTLTWAQWDSYANWWGLLGGVTTFHNAGTLTKTAGAGTTAVYNYLDNSGTVQARSGTLQFNDGSNLGGLFEADSGAAIDFSGPYNYAWDGTGVFEGPGRVGFVGGNATLTGTITNLTASGITIRGLSNVVGTANLTDCAIDDQETISGVVNWQGLNLGYSGSLTVAPNGVLNLVSNDIHNVYATLTNFGTINWLGGDIYVYNGAEPGGASYGPTYTGEIWNETGAQWSIQCDQTLTWAQWDSYGNWWGWLGGVTTFHNAGTLTKIAGTGITAIDNYFDDSGLVQARSGTLQFNDGGILNGGFQVDPAASIGVAGNLDGANAIAGTLNWSGGQLNPGASILVATNGVLNLLDSVTLSGVFTNRGTVNWQAGNVAVRNDGSGSTGAVWNEAGARWDIECDQIMSCWNCGAYEQFHNAGLFRKDSGTNTTSINVYFDNPGAVEAVQGTLQFNNGANHLGGGFIADAGATIALPGNYTAGPWPTFGGAGTISYNGVITIDPAFAGTAISNLTLSGSTINGTATFGGNVTLVNSTLNGMFSVADGGILHWAGGQLNPGSALTVSTSGTLDLDSVNFYGVVTNQGTVNWQTGDLQVYNYPPYGYTGEIWNEAGGLWDIQCDQTLLCWQCGANEQFHNAGLFRKSAGTNTTSVNVYFDDTGVVEAVHGALQFNNAGDRLAGGFIADAGASIHLPGSYTVGPWPSFGGPGTITYNGTITVDPAFAESGISNLAFTGSTLNGAATVTGALSLTNTTVTGQLSIAEGGVLNWAGGSLNPGAVLVVATNATLNLLDTLDLGGALTNQGTVNWLAGTIYAENDGGGYTGAIWNQAGAVWDIQCDQSMVQGWPWWWWGSGYAQFSNSGIVRKTVGLGWSYLYPSFDNHGALDAESGGVYLGSGFVLEPDGTLNVGIRSRFTFGQIALPGNAALAGAISATLLDGYTPAPGDSFAVLGYGSQGGAFDSLVLPPNVFWQPSYGAAAFTLNVSSALRLAPIPAQVILEQMPFTLAVTATDPAVPPGALTFGLGSAPSGMSIDPATGLISWTPTHAQSVSTNTISLWVTDDSSPALSNSTSFVVIVLPNRANALPVLPDLAAQSVDRFNRLTVTNTAAESDPYATVSYTLLEAPDGAAIDSAGIITWTPGSTQGFGSYQVTTVATSTDPADAAAPQLSATNRFTVVVNEPNTVPVLSSLRSRTVNELTLLTVTNSAAATDSRASLAYRLLEPPAGAAIDAHGVFTWTPSQAQSPSTNQIAIAVDSLDALDSLHPVLSATNWLTVVVREVNAPPVPPVIPTQFVNELTLLTVTNTAAEWNIHSRLGYSLVRAPAGAAMDSQGIITWTPVQTQSPSTNVIITVVTSTNYLDLFKPFVRVTNSFTVVVREVNVAPVLADVPEQEVNELTLLTFTNSATVANIHSALSYLLLDPPAGAAVDTNGVVTWTPDQTQSPGTNVLRTVATSANPYDSIHPLLSATNTVSVVVKEINVAPVLPAIGRQTVSALTLLRVTNTATEANLHSTHSYSLLDPPAGAWIDAEGVFTWTPSVMQSPATNVIVTVVTNSNPYDQLNPHLSATNRFEVVVLAPALALEAIANRTVNVGQTVRFTNSTTGGAGPLTYSLLTAPAGAAVEPGTGVFTWRPPVWRAGSSNYFQLRVADTNSPPVSDTKSFAVLVNNLEAVRLTPLMFSNGVFTLSVAGGVGPDYILQSSTDFVDWKNLSTNTPAVMPLGIMDTNAAAEPARFYRVRLGP